ncbi:MAG TPA: EamA family transporter RarD [Steroidobacteraceae bacterium]|nr:EamA family transporter RarD [Steroidobacteraceae bacterium]
MSQSSLTTAAAGTSLAADANAPRIGRGYAAALAAFVIWGLFPIYFIGLRHVSAMEITAHRIVWSCVFVIGWLAVSGDLGRLFDAARRPGVLVRLVSSAFFIAVNWVGFAWAVNNHRVLDVSLAYFIGPLLNVLLGILVLSERLNRAQWLSVAFATAGVAYLSFVAGHAPWIALLVGSSFAFYGLIRKTVNIDALPGLAIETILLAPFAVAYLVWCELNGTAAFGHADALVLVLLLAGGIFTSVPLVLFAFGARQVPYSTIGVLQFIGPSLQLVCGLLVFHESLSAERAHGFVLIWIGLAIYVANALWKSRPQAAP